MGKFFHTNNTKCMRESETNSQSKNLVTNTQKQHAKLKASLFLQWAVSVPYTWDMSYSLKIFSELYSQLPMYLGRKGSRYTKSYKIQIILIIKYELRSGVSQCVKMMCTWIFLLTQQEREDLNFIHCPRQRGFKFTAPISAFVIE